MRRCSRMHLLRSVLHYAGACLPTMRGGMVLIRCYASAYLPTELLTMPSGDLFLQVPGCAGFIWTHDKLGVFGDNKPPFTFSLVFQPFRWPSKKKSMRKADSRRSQSCGKLCTRRTCSVRTQDVLPAKATRKAESCKVSSCLQIIAERYWLSMQGVVIQEWRRLARRKTR